MEINKSNSKDDIEFLKMIYDKWLNAMPDIPPFSDIRNLKFHFNPRVVHFDENSKKLISSPASKMDLLNALIANTNFVLSQIDTSELKNSLSINEINSINIDLIAERHRLKQSRLFQEYDEIELGYINKLEHWLENEKIYFAELLTELNKLPEQKALPKQKTYFNQSSEPQSVVNNIDNAKNDLPMTLKILNDICYGSLKPWTILFQDQTKLSEQVRVAHKINIESPKDLLNKLNGLLSDFSDFKSFLTTDPTFVNINPLTYSFEKENSPNIETKFYQELIDAEALRYYNEVLVNPLIQDLTLDVEYQVQNKVLDTLKDLLLKTKAELQNQQTLQKCKDRDDLTLFVIQHLHLTLLALYFSIQKHFALYLKNTYDTVADFYLYVFNESHHDLVLFESQEVIDQSLNTNKSSPSNLPKVKADRKLSFGFNGDENKLRSILKSLCLHYNFINESLSSQDKFIAAFVSKDLSRFSDEIHLSCATNVFTATISHFKKIAPNFTYATIDKSGIFYSTDGTLLNQKLLSNSEKQSKLDKQIRDKISTFFS